MDKREGVIPNGLKPQEFRSDVILSGEKGIRSKETAIATENSGAEMNEYSRASELETPLLF